MPRGGLFRHQQVASRPVVSTHPYWETVEVGKRVDQRMALKHVHEQDADVGRAEAA